MDKLKMHSPNFVDQNIAKIAELFPNCVTESRNERGINIDGKPGAENAKYKAHTC